eukprot:6940315-Prymnesium_polylepis.1
MKWRAEGKRVDRGVPGDPIEERGWRDRREREGGERVSERGRREQPSPKTETRAAQMHGAANAHCRVSA